MYASSAVSDLGSLYLLAAMVPFFFLHRMRSKERHWILGLVAVYLCLAFLLLLVLNPTSDRESREICSMFFSASHLILAVWAGYGLMLVGSRFADK